MARFMILILTVRCLHKVWMHTFYLLIERLNSTKLNLFI